MGPASRGSAGQLLNLRGRTMGRPGLGLRGVPPGHGIEAKVHRQFSGNWPGGEWEERSR